MERERSVDTSNDYVTEMQCIAGLIRSVSPERREVAANRLRQLVRSDGARFGHAREEVLAALAAVCFDDQLWHAITEVRQVVTMTRAHANADEGKPCSTLEALTHKAIR